MATYVLSDIHGDLDRFRKMQDKIGFSAEDELYVLGDVIDRGRDGIEILLKIMNTPNIHMLLGNHEYMMLQAFSGESDDRIVSNWMYNGGKATARAFLGLSANMQQKLYGWLSRLPVNHQLRVNGQDFYFVHGWPSEESKAEQVWGRPVDLSDRSSLVPEGAKLIIGHTPVALILHPSDQQQEAYFRMLEQTGGHMQILHMPGYIDIDCGCAYKVPGAALACLRLEDMREFYV